MLREAVVGSVRSGADGVPCFCHVPQSSRAFSFDRIASLYAACVGSVPGDAGDLGGKCPSPPSAADALVCLRACACGWCRLGGGRHSRRPPRSMSPMNRWRAAYRTMCHCCSVLLVRLGFCLAFVRLLVIACCVLVCFSSLSRTLVVNVMISCAIALICCSSIFSRETRCMV